MTTTKQAKAWISTQGQTLVAQVSNLVRVGTGYHAKVEEEGGLVTLRVAGVESSSQPAITAVHTVPIQGGALTWTTDGSGFVSSPLRHGDEFRIEVSTDDGQPDPVPVGGGHFRVVEEGGGVP